MLGGGVVRNAAMFIDDLRRMVKELATQVPTDHLRIEAVEDTGIAGLQGAAAAFTGPGVRQPTGSKHAGSFSANDYPNNIWLLDEVPVLEVRTWRLRVDGRVRRPYEVSYADLSLFQTQVTNHGLLALAGKLGLTPCENLVVSGPKVTSSGIRSLRSKLPKVQVNASDLKLTTVRSGLILASVRRAMDSRDAASPAYCTVIELG